MVWTIIEYAATAIECWIWTAFLCRFLKCKSNIPSILIYGIIFIFNFGITSFLNSFTLFEGFLGIVRIIINFGLAYFLLKGSAFEKLFASFILDITAILIHYIIMNIICRFFSVNMTELAADKGILRLTTLFIILFLFFLFTKIMLKMRNHDLYVFTKSEWLTLSAVFIITMSVEVQIFKIAYTFEMSIQNPDAIGAGLGLFTVNILVYCIMRQMSRKNQENTTLLIDKMQLEVYKSQLVDSEKQQEDIKQIRHDMRNHLQYISGLIQVQAYDKAQNYLEDILKSKLDFGYVNVKTGSRVVDIIANSKLSLCNANKIRTATTISHFELDMEDIDICIVLGNLFDNAIEACCKVESERFLFFEMVQNKGYVHLTLKNSIEGSVLETNPELHTTKEEKKLHGVGLRSVKSVVTKYDGMMSFYEEHDMFVIDVWLPAKKQ